MTWLLALLLVLGSIHASVEPGRAANAVPVGTLMGPSAPPAASQAILTGVASWYGPGTGVATQWCTWTLRHQIGCGFLAIQSHDTGLVVIAPVIDWCQCYRGTPNERIVDLQLGVVGALGLDPAAGLYAVMTWPVDTAGLPDTAVAP